MRTHDHIDIRFDRVMKRNQIVLLDFLFCGVYNRKSGMTVNRGIAMPREMLPGSSVPGTLKGLDFLLQLPDLLL